MSGGATEVEVEGRTLTLTNLDKVFYPEAGFTKAHVIDYYRRVSPVLLPHLRGRALTLKRYPDGVEGPFFYEKSCPPHRPEWLSTQGVWSDTRGEDIDYCVVDSLPALVWAANIADLELHAFLARAVEDPQAPTALVYDLDPGEGTGILECCEVGLALRDVHKELGLECFPKVSGSKGLQVYVPLNVEGVTFEETKPFARAMGEVLERAMPDLVTTNMKKTERRGRVLVDWSQNDDHKTTVCVYSLRAKRLPTVSTPLRWGEVTAALDASDADALRFLPEDVFARVEKHGDLFRPVLEMEQSLPVLG